MKPLVALALFAALSATALGGPGGSGGNPNALISGLERGYVFRATFPTAVRIGEIDYRGAADDVYEFGLLSYEVRVAVVPYDPAACARESPHKTVCTTYEGLGGDAGKAVSLIVFGDKKTYRVIESARGPFAAQLREHHEELLRGFLRSDAR